MRRAQKQLLKSMVLSITMVGLSIPTAAGAQLPQISPLRSLPGDAAVGTAVEKQDWVRIAAGGPGFLLVWEDQRTVLTGFVNTTSPIAGNETDIYAARLDASGNLLDSSPIIVSNEGRNQTRPQVAWNGSDWLVVWTTQRPDWYFFEDIVGVRISPAGEVLDAAPIPIRLENNDPANDGGRMPSVTSNGSDWLVVWEDIVYSGNLAFPAVAGARVAADGTVLDPPRVVLHQHSSASFGPREPQAAWALDEYLVVWSEAASEVLSGRRFDADLNRIDASPFSIGFGPKPRVGTDGSDFLVASHRNLAYRVTHGGQVLDPSGIDFDAGHGFRETGPELAWSGFEWVLTFAATPTQGPQDDTDLYLARIAPDGSVSGPPAPVFDSGADDFKPVIAQGDGGLQLAFVDRDVSALRREDVRTVALSGTAAGNALDVSVGLPRQAFPRVHSRPGIHVTTFVSQGGGVRRLLAQRTDDRGQALDPEPIVVAELLEGRAAFPDVAFDGSRYLVTWVEERTLMGRRFSPDLAPLDPAPVPLLADAATAVAVSGLDDHFLLIYPHRFSGDQQPLRGVRLRGSDLQVTTGPFTVGANYALGPRVRVAGDRWLAVWVRNPSHDNSRSEVRAAFIGADGVPEAPFVVDQAGFGDDASLAVGEGRVLITWSDNQDFNSADIEGRLIDLAGAFLGNEFAIADQQKDLFFPVAGWAGDRFVVAWADYRSVSGVEQMRADIFATAVSPAGVPEPFDGFALSEGPLPEDLPAVAASPGRAIVLFSHLEGVASPEVQRLGYRVLTYGAPSTSIFADGFETGDTSAWTTTVGGP